MRATSSMRSETLQRRLGGRRSVPRSGDGLRTNTSMSRTVSVAVTRELHQLSNKGLLVSVHRVLQQALDALAEMTVRLGTAQGLDPMDEWMVRRLAAFFGKDQFFVQLLPRADAGVDDRDVDLGAESPHPDHLPRQVIHANPLTHLEHEDVPPVRVAGRLNDEAG